MQNRLCGMCFFFLDRQDDFRPTIISASICGGGLRRLNRTDHLPPRMTLMRLDTQILHQLVRDKDDRFALLDQLAHDDK